MTLEDTIKALYSERPVPVQKIVAAMAKASLVADPAEFDAIILTARLDDVFEQLIAYPALALLPAWGSRGLSSLVNFAIEGPHESAALSVLAAVSLGRVPTSNDVVFLREDWDNLVKYKLDPSLPAEAIRCVKEVVLEQLTDTYKKSRLLNAIWSQAMFAPDNPAQTERLDFLIDMLVDTHLVLNEDILNQFAALLNQSPEREEQLHRFLVEHPVLLDPFVTELRTKHELGDDFITDFVVRRTNNEYVVVEIENSTDDLFKTNGSFTPELMTAVAQVRDFQAWIADNIAYAQTKLPGIRHPEGLVIIGRRQGLSTLMQTRLSEENFSRRGHIKIATYDDLLSQARSVYRNALERPVVLRSRDQKTL
jgi:hypothetical protein